MSRSKASVFPFSNDDERRNSDPTDIGAMTMDSPLIGKVMKCIKRNDGENLREILADIDPQVTKQLLNEDISLDTGDTEKPGRTNCFKKLEYRKIVYLAAASGADKVVNVLIDLDVDLLIDTSCSGNLLHALCWGSYFYKKNQQACVKIFHLVFENVSIQAQKKLLMETDDEDFRPLELATKLGTFLLLRAYLETEGVYRHTLKNMGAWDLVEYTLNEYESVDQGSRVHRSPMKLFTYLLESDLQAEGAVATLELPAIQKWMHDKRRMSLMLLVVWLFIRALFLYYAITIFTSFNYDYKASNVTIYNGSKFLDKDTGLVSCVHLIIGLTPREAYSAGSLQTLLLLCVAFDILDGCRFLFQSKSRMRLRRPGASSPYIASHNFHRVIQAIYMIAVECTLSQAYAGVPHVSKWTAPSLCVISLVSASWTFLFIMQHYPAVGHLAIGFQRSLASFGAFSILFIIIFMSFSLGTLMLANASCLEHSFIDSIYFTFQIFLNQINLDQEVAHTGLHNEWRLFHITFVVITTVLLLNYFIAVLSESMMSLSSHREIIQNLVLLNTAILLDDRYGWLLRRVMGWRAKRNGTVLGNFKVREGL